MNLLEVTLAPMPKNMTPNAQIAWYYFLAQGWFYFLTEDGHYVLVDENYDLDDANVFPDDESFIRYMDSTIEGDRLASDIAYVRYTLEDSHRNMVRTEDGDCLFIKDGKIAGVKFASEL